ncbi:YkgB family protein [Maricaulis sp. CAU 1757]
MLAARLALIILFAWFGAMNFTAVGVATVEGWLAGHALLSQLANQASSAATAIGIYQLVAAAVLAVPIAGSSFHRIGYAMIGLYAALALTVLFTNPVWSEAAGGFPAIGSGQGILKYVSILGLALWGGSFGTGRMFTHRHSEMRLWSQPIMWFGLVLVLGWIGAMKFTAVEAAGIEPLLRTSLLFSWIVGLLPVQQISNAIGVVELLTVAALAGFWFNRRLYRIGLWLCLVTFLVTLSFLLSFPGAWEAGLGGFPALSPTGHFLLKDLILFAVALALMAETGREGVHRMR